MNRWEFLTPKLKPVASVQEEAVQLANRMNAEGVFIMALPHGGGIRSTWHGTPSASLTLPSLLRQMADDMERKMGLNHA